MVNARKRTNNLRYFYGITPTDYDKMLQARARCCAICELPAFTFPTPLEIDHHHPTNKVRGLLCHGCNIRVGTYESFTGLRKDHPLFKYIEEYVDSKGVQYDFT